MKRAKSIREYLDRNDISQKELAETLRISQSFLCDIIAGRRVPSLAIAHRIEQATGVPMAALLKREAA